MKIRKMDATFGKLNRSSLSLSDGLNIICGDNESGKSTWCSFIRSMLYGINTREQSKNGFIADKERFRPWSGEGMHGRMEVHWQDKELVMERTSGRGGVFQSPIITDKLTGLNVADIDVPGESMLGVKKEVFERSAFIGQALLKVENDKSGELERRIVSMAGSGEEDVSYSQVEQKLKSWKNRRRYYNRGEAPALEEKIEKLKNILNSLRGDAKALTMKMAQIEKLREEEKEYSRQAEIWKSLRAWEKVNLNEDARMQAAAAEEEYKKTVASSMFGDVLPDDEYYEKLLQIYQRYVNDEKNYTISIENVRKAEEELKAEQQALSEFGALAQVGKTDAQLAQEQAENIKERLAQKHSPIAALLGSVFGVLGVAGAFVLRYLRVGRFSAIAFAASGAVVLLGIIVQIIISAVAKKNKKALQAQLNEILELYGVAEVAEIVSQGEKCARQKSIVEKCLSSVAAVRNNMERMELIRKDSREALNRAVKELDAEATEADAPALIEQVRMRIDALKTADNKLKTAKVRLDTIKSGQNLDAFLKDAQVCAPGTEKPEFSEEELGVKLDIISSSLRELELDCSGLQARINQVGEQGDLQERLRQAKEELSVKNTETQALEYALQELSQANGEMQRRFAPALEKKAGEIFAYLTGGHFNLVEIRNAQMEVFVREEAAAQSRDVLELSQGTVDELYLAMRLALSDMLSDKEPIPLVLDDALVNFDDKRMAKAIDYLKELAKERQIILFTCQTREAEYAKKFDGCTVQKL